MKLKVKKGMERVLDVLSHVPLVSIILTSNGRWELLNLALKSVAEQSFKDFELILVADCTDRPSDDFDRFVKIMGHSDTVTRVIPYRAGRHEESVASYKVKRIARMVNLGLDSAAGKFVTYLCDDDTMEPDALARRVAAMAKGARWVVDRVRWVNERGVRFPQELIGRYIYPKPNEEGHIELVKEIRPSLVNWICHDCSMHEATDIRWEDDDDKAKAPVDWRFWCALYRSGLRPVLLDEVGAEAFLPGLWRKGFKIEAAIAAKTGGVGMSSTNVKYAVNVGHEGPAKIEIITTLDGKTIEVPPQGRIPAHLVTTPNGALYPSFIIEGGADFPTLAPAQAEPDFEVKEGDVEDDAPTVDGPLFEAPAPKKAKYKREESKVDSDEVLGVAELNRMFKRNLIKLADEKFGLHASMSMTKPKIVRMILEAQG